MKTKSNGKSTEMPNAHLHDLYVDELRDVLGAERQLIKGLKKMKTHAKAESLKSAFESHLMETETHIERLSEILQSMNLSARGKKCKAMEGLLNEADEIIEEFDGDEAADAALIAAAQKIEHYEIASYGCLVTYAMLMKHRKAEQILAETLKEEKQTDAKLTNIAMEEANIAPTQ